MGRRTILTITTPLHRCLRRSDRQDRWRGARAMGSIRSEPAKPPAIWGMSVHLMTPYPRLCRRPAGWALEMRGGHAVEHPVVADPGHIGRAARFEAGQQPLLGEAGVHAEHGDLAHRSLKPIDQVEDKVE